MTSEFTASVGPGAANTLMWRSQSGRTELSAGPRGTRLHVLTGKDTLTDDDVARLAQALDRIRTEQS